MSTKCSVILGIILLGAAIALFMGYRDHAVAGLSRNDVAEIRGEVLRTLGYGPITRANFRRWPSLLGMRLSFHLEEVRTVRDKIRSVTIHPDGTRETNCVMAVRFRAKGIPLTELPVLKKNGKWEAMSPGLFLNYF